MFRSALIRVSLFYIVDTGCIAVSMFGNFCLTPAKQNAILRVFGSLVSLDGKVREVN